MGTFLRRKTKWKKGGRLRGRQAEGIDGADTIRLKPDPILKAITLDVATAGLQLLGVDIEDLLAGRPVKPRPPITRGPEFLKAILVNPSDYNLATMPMDRAAGIITVLSATFFFECNQHALRLLDGVRGKRKDVVS